MLELQDVRNLFRNESSRLFSYMQSIENAL